MATSDTSSVASGCRRRSTSTAPATNASTTATGDGEPSSANIWATSTAAAPSASSSVERPRAPADRSSGVDGSRARSCDVAPPLRDDRGDQRHRVQPTSTTPAAPMDSVVQPGSGDALRGAERRHVEDRRVDHLHAAGARRRSRSACRSRRRPGCARARRARPRRSPDSAAATRLPPATSATSPAPTSGPGRSASSGRPTASVTVVASAATASARHGVGARPREQQPTRRRDPRRAWRVRPSGAGTRRRRRRSRAAGRSNGRPAIDSVLSASDIRSPHAGQDRREHLPDRQRDGHRARRRRSSASWWP